MGQVDNQQKYKIWYLHHNTRIQTKLSFPLCFLRLSWSLWVSLRNINHIVPPVLLLMLEMVCKKHAHEVTPENIDYFKTEKDKGKIIKKTFRLNFFSKHVLNPPKSAKPEICALMRSSLENSKECLFLKNISALRWPKKGSRPFRMYPLIGECPAIHMVLS